MEYLMMGHPPKGHPQRKEFDRAYIKMWIFLGVLLIGAFVFLFTAPGHSICLGCKGWVKDGKHVEVTDCIRLERKVHVIFIERKE